MSVKLNDKSPWAHFRLGLALIRDNNKEIGI